MQRKIQCIHPNYALGHHPHVIHIIFRFFLYVVKKKNLTKHENRQPEAAASRVVDGFTDQALKRNKNSCRPRLLVHQQFTR